MTTVQAGTHRPRYTYCTSPEDCCYTYGPVAITCAADAQSWPCTTKRSHHTAAHAQRLARWVVARVQRGYREY